MFAPKTSKANKHNAQIVSTDNQIGISVQNQNEIINPAEKISEISEKDPDETQLALMPVPEPNPSPAEATTEDTVETDQIGAATTRESEPEPAPAPAPAEPKRPPKGKRGRRGRPRSTRTISTNPSPEAGLEDNRKRWTGRLKVTDDDNWLPPYWVVRIETRKSGATAGRKNKYYISPEGRPFRSRIAAEKSISRSTTEVVANNYHLHTRSTT